MGKVAVSGVQEPDVALKGCKAEAASGKPPLNFSGVGKLTVGCNLMVENRKRAGDCAAGN